MDPSFAQHNQSWSKTQRAPPPINVRGIASSAACSKQASGEQLLEDRDLLQSIVKVFTVHSSPNYFMPWQNKPQRETSGSGVVVEIPKLGVGVLTNAHVVADQTFVQVRRHGSSVKHQARVHAVGHECDLAVLVVDDPSFWTDSTIAKLSADESDASSDEAKQSSRPKPNKTVTPLPMGSVPNLQEQVTVMGFPQGGDNLSITSGVVSRVELTNYVHGAASLLAIQLDAAINPGNSGGPAVQNGQVVGLAFQNLANSDNIGYVIPTPIVKRFLEDMEKGGTEGQGAVDGSGSIGKQSDEMNADSKKTNPPFRHAGFCALGVKCQALDNPALREFYGMLQNETGVLLTHVTPLSPSKDLLKKDDVLLEIDGKPIANDGTVSFRGWERVAFDHLVTLKKPGEEVALKVRRKKGVDDLTGTTDEANNEDTSTTLLVMVAVKPLQRLVPAHQYDVLPSFYVYAGLVFSPLTQPHLHEFGDDWFNTAPRKLCDRAMHAHAKEAGEQVVLLSQVLADEINAGYQGMHDLEVRAVNGEKIKNLKELRHLIERASGEFLRLDLADDRVLVVNRKEANKAHGRIMAKHRVPSVMSKDLEE